MMYRCKIWTISFILIWFNALRIRNQRISNFSPSNRPLLKIVEICYLGQTSAVLCVLTQPNQYNQCTESAFCGTRKQSEPQGDPPPGRVSLYGVLTHRPSCGNWSWATSETLVAPSCATDAHCHVHGAESAHSADFTACEDTHGGWSDYVLVDLSSSKYDLILKEHQPLIAAAERENSRQRSRQQCPWTIRSPE